MSSKDSDRDFLQVVGCFGVLLSVPLLIAVSAVASGWALVKMWGWFVLPVFESAPILSIPQAIGIGMIVSYLTYHRDTSKKEEKKGSAETIIEAYIYAVLHPALVVFIGWCVTYWL